MSSSIFSSESARELRRGSLATGLAVVAVVAGIELGLRALPWSWLVPPESFHNAFESMNRDIIPRFDSPRILAMGSSRMMFATLPRVLDEALDLPQMSTLSTSFYGSRTFQQRLFYESHRDRLRRATLAILNVDEWFFNSGYEFSFAYQSRAPLAERLRLGDPSARRRLALDALFQMRLRLPMLPGALSRALAGNGAAPLRLYLDDDHVPTATHEPAGVTPAPQRVAAADDGAIPDTHPAELERKAHRFYRGFRLDAGLVEDTERLVRMLQDDGLRVLLLQLPHHGGYQDMVERFHPDEFAAQRRALRELAARLGTPLRAYDRPGEVGLDDSAFRDWSHMTRDGAHRFTRFLAELIEREGWLEGVRSPG